VDPGTDTARRVGTGADTTFTLPPLSRPMYPARQSPVDLFAIGAVPLVIVNGTQAIAVSMDCGRPGEPVIFTGRVYLPCLGEGRVLVFDRTGLPHGSDIALSSGGDPRLSIYAGELWITAIDGSGFVVQADGSVAPTASGVGVDQTSPAPGGSGSPASSQVPSGSGAGSGAGSGGGSTTHATPATSGSSGTNGPPPVPHAGDSVVTGSSDRSTCGPAACTHHYAITLGPPHSWSAFSGTCILHIVGTVSANDPIPCGTTNTLSLTPPIEITGDGTTYTVSLEACGATCVPSNSIQVVTLPKEIIGCRTC
jgi:hypothetical protein